MSMAAEGGASAGTAFQAGNAAPATVTNTTSGAVVSGGAASQPPASTGDWTTGLNDDSRGWIQNKGYKDIATQVESHRNLEKLLGAKEKLIKLPDNFDEPGALNEVYSRLGRPEKAEDYQLEVPKDGGSPEFAKWASQQFHELGLSAKQGRALVQKWNEYQGNTTKAQMEKQMADNQAQVDGLKRNWGAAYEQNVKVAKQAVREFGVKPEVIDKLEQAVGFSEVMNLFHSIGSKIGEASFVTSQSGNSFVMTPEAARNRIQSLRGDSDFVRRYAQGDSSAKSEMERLHKMAYLD